MATYEITVSPDNVKLKHRERYITEGENERSLAYPSGCYRGFIPMESTVPDMKVHLKIDPLTYGYDTDSFAVYNEYNETTSNDGWSLSIRESADLSLELAGTAFDPIPAGVTYLYLYITAEYGIGTSTSVQYVFSDIDPRIANPDALVIGRIPVTPAATTITFDITSPATWVDVLTPRTYPAPTAVELLSSLGAGDKFWGYYDSLSAWRTPTVDEKKAMVNASSPDASNPFATVDETVNLYEAEWTTFDLVIDPTLADAFGMQKVAITGDWYIGNGARPTDAARYFRIYSKVSPVLGYDSSFALDYGGIRAIKAWDFLGLVALTPSVSSDSEGFYTNPHIQIYTDTEQITTQEFTIAGYTKKTQGTKSQAPVGATGFAADHAQNISVKRITSPPIWGETSITSDTGRNGLQDVVHDLHARARGPMARSLSAENLNMQLHKLPSTLLHEQGGCDAHPFSPENTFPWFGVPFADTIPHKYSVRKILPWRLGGIGPKVIVTGLDNGYPASGGPAVGLTDPSAGTTTVTRLTPLLPASTGTRWVFQDACCDNDAIYVRVADNSAIGNNRILKLLYDLGVDPAWPTEGLSLGNFSPSSGTALSDAAIRSYANLINANGNYLAANDQYTDVNGAVASVGGVKIIRKSDGVVTGGGTGDLISAGAAPINYVARCNGPIVSDGTNIYFTCHEENSGGGGVTRHHIGMCQVGNPTASSVPGWYSRYALTADEVVPSDLVFDGFYLWAFGGDPTGTITPPYYMVSKTAVFYGWSAGDYEVPDMDATNEDELFGPACFDGKDIWQMSHNETPNRGSCTAKRLSVRQGVQRLDTGSSDYAELVKESIGAIGADSILSVGDGFSIGAIAFDGEDIWYSLDGTSAGTATLSGFMFRISNIKDI